MIYTRDTYETENLRKEDFIHGLGYDTSLLTKLRKKKNILKSSEFDFYHEAGVSIDGTIRVKKFHPLLNNVLIDNRENSHGRELIIESVHKHWYMGYYWVAVYRTVGTKSHGVCFFKNINCIDSNIIDSITEIVNHISFKDSTLNWNKF